MQCPELSSGAGLWPGSLLGRCCLASQRSGANLRGAVEAAQSRPQEGSSRWPGRPCRAGGACATWTRVPRAPSAVRVGAARGPRGQPGPGEFSLQADPLTPSRDPAP